MMSPAPAAASPATASLASNKPLAERTWYDSSVWLWLELFAILLVYVGTIGRLPLLGRDEPRYAQVAREMWQSGDWITPRLGGFTWFEKPALLYWLMAATYALFGVAEWTARLASALSGVATVALLWWVVRRVRSEWAWWSALPLAASGGMIFYSHGTTFDIVLTACVTLSLTGFWFAQLETRPAAVRNALALFWIGAGLAFLDKGLVAFVLCLGTAGLYAWLRRERVKLGWAWGLPLALLIGATWYGPVIWRNGWPFIKIFFVEHQFERFTSNKYKHHQPFWYYLPALLVLALPWTPALLVALGKMRLAALRENTDESRLLALALIWMLVPVAFFSVSGSKLPSYIMPAMPGAFILVGLVMSRWTKAKSGEIIGLGLATLMLFGSAALLVSKIGVARGEQESMRGLLRKADAQGLGNTRLVQLGTMQYTAQFYAAKQLMYDSKGEPIRLENPQQVAQLVQGKPLLVFVEGKGRRILPQLTSVQTQKIGETGDTILFVVRPLHIPK